MVAKTRNNAEAKSRSLQPAMAVILRDVPAGHNWGWFSREDQRMHLQSLDRKNFGLYKVWLEHRGKRAIEPVGILPAKVLKRLSAEVERKRRYIEGRWTSCMIDRGWSELHVVL